MFALSGNALPSAAAKPAAASAPKPAAAKSAPAKPAPKPATVKASAAKSSKPAATQTITGSAGVNYSFKLPAGLTLATPTRDNAANFAEYSASAAGGENSRPFRFEARLAKFESPVDCAIFTQFTEGLTRTFLGDHYLDQSPAAPLKLAGAAFLVKRFHKDVEPDFNKKSAALNVSHYLTTQGDQIFSLVFYTDAADEAKGQALRDTLLKSLKFGASTGVAVCKATPHSSSTPAPTPTSTPAKPGSSPK